MQSQISDPNVPFGYPTTPEKIVCETPSSTEDISMGDAQEPQHTKANKTNQVRSAGACITCRLQKVTCSAAYPCEYCKKAYPQKPEVCCIRHELSVVAQEIAFRRFDCFDRNEDIAIKKICRTAQLKFHDSLFVGRIFLDRDPTKFGLEVILRNYECSADDRTILHRGCTFSKDHDNQALTIKSLQNWVEQSTSSLELITFEGGIGYFIKICSTSLLPASLRPQIRTLLQKAHVFRCMFNILYCRDLFFLQANVEEPQQLPSPAQAEIRGVAKSAIESSERDIFAELDRFFKAHKFNEVERAIVWAVLWQLMLTYRGLLRNTKPWCNNAEPLLNAVAVFYASLFRTSASLKLSLDSIKLQNPAVAGAFNFALSLRDIFYKSIGAGDAEVDQRLNDLVVRREIKQLDIDERVKRVLLNTPLIDGHNDLPQQPRACFHGKIHNNPKFDFANGFERGMTDIPRLREGAVGGQFWSICVPCLRSAENFSTAEYSDMARDAIEQIDLTLRLVESYPETFELVNGPDDVKNIYESGRIACSIGIEGLHMAGNSIGIIRAFYRLGVRYCTLTHVCNNAFADSSTSKVGAVHGGLSKLGRSAIVEMNRIGMIVDISHVSEDCAKQVLELSRAPVMFSHSNVKGVFDCARNVPDHILDMVPANNGIVMVTFVPEHVTTRRRDAKMEMVLDHLFYVAERIGWDHVGLGSDFDGIASVIPGLEDVKCYPNLLKAILDRGATEEQLAKVAGENILRVWRGVEKVRDEMKAEGVLPVEDVWEGREWWRYDGYYQMKDEPYMEERGYDWYGVPPPEEGLYLDDK
ncbi:microsomal dipeptidase [Colletotrichum karsti]|uniref:Dipeptidase n=1 Tax=Colletotrichum karsti TaxID=1095194 RepID=A0A9P6IHK0_9PEZI|nr:microsomal dipeptidase [Colletotrichum karsti]KAF9879130.1 microsomal dipeptidase [Colletotrichum karsti]